MLSKILSATLIGIDAHIVEVEVDITSKGLPHFSSRSAGRCGQGEQGQGKDGTKEYRVQLPPQTDNRKSRPC